MRWVLGLDGGRGGIRTHGRLAPSPVFKTGALNHSATRPRPSMRDRGGQCKPLAEPNSRSCTAYGRRSPTRRILTFMAPSLAIIGAGMGGLTLAAALHQRGI